MPELGLELVRDVDRERFRSRLPRWDPRLWGDAQFSKNTRPGNRLLKLGLAWGRERVKARKLQQENVTSAGDDAPVSRFTGKEEDIEIGLQYFGKRFLSPYLGRWVSADPLAVHEPGKADLNLYAYVNGRVLMNTDPLGLDDEKQLNDQRPIIETACKLLSDRAVLVKARDRQMAKGGLAEKMLNHFLDATGTPVTVDLNKMLKADPGMQLRINREVTAQVEKQLAAGKTGSGISGLVFVRQNDYSVEDNQLALGGTYVWFHVDATADARAKNQSDGKLTIKLNLIDRYLWSPNDSSRPTQCLHQAAARLAESGEAKEFNQFGEGETRLKMNEDRVFDSSSSEEMTKVAEGLQEPVSNAPVQEDHP